MGGDAGGGLGEVDGAFEKPVEIERAWLRCNILKSISKIILSCCPSQWHFFYIFSIYFPEIVLFPYIGSDWTCIVA
jgi:hypothetical protein